MYSYWEYLLDTVPYHLLLMLFCFLIVGLVIFPCLHGWRKGIALTIKLILLEVIFLIYSATVFCRDSAGVYKYDYSPFWSYVAILKGSSELVAQILMNVLVFVPVGMLLGMVFPRWSWYRIVVIGCAISISIELLQLVLMCGLSEIDDVIHNTFGCAMGYLLYALLTKIRRLSVKAFA